MVENTTFTTVRDFVAWLEVFANKYLPGIHFHIESNDVWYTMSATDEGQVHSEKSIALLQEWLSTGIATAIKTKLKVIAMQYDNKTGVYNDSMIHRVWNNSTSSVIFFDINQFKRINDTVSYAKWDEMLQSFAQILKEGKKMLSHAEVIRNGGDEFLVIVENTDLHSIMLYISRVQKLFSQIPGSHGASYGYFFRRGDNTYTTFSKAYSYADQHMKSRKWREWKIYRIQQSIESLSDEEKIELTKNLLWNLDSESLNLILDSHKK